MKLLKKLIIFSVLFSTTVFALNDDPILFCMPSVVCPAGGPIQGKVSVDACGLSNNFFIGSPAHNTSIDSGIYNFSAAIDLGNGDVMCVYNLSNNDSKSPAIELFPLARDWMKDTNYNNEAWGKNPTNNICADASNVCPFQRI